MLIAEDLLLLLTKDDTGKLVAASTEVDVALGGAMLIELTLMERVDLTAEGQGVRPGRLVVRDAGATSDALLDDALRTVADKEGKKPQAVVTPLGKGLRKRLYERLVDRGILRAESGKVLGVFPTQQWPAQDAAHEDAVRVRLVHALRVGAADDDRVAALVSLLNALRSVHKVVDPDEIGLSKKELGARAKQIAEGDWGSAAVRRALDDMMAAIMTAVVAGAVAGGSS